MKYLNLRKWNSNNTETNTKFIKVVKENGIVTTYKKFKTIPKSKIQIREAL